MFRDINIGNFEKDSFFIAPGVRASVPPARQFGSTLGCSGTVKDEREDVTL